MSFESEKPVAEFDDLGLVMVIDHPAYDNGDYYVIDTVEGLKWAVVSNEGIRMFTDIDKYRCIEYADDLKRAEHGRD